MLIFLLSSLCCSLRLPLCIFVTLQIPRHAWCNRLPGVTAAVWQCQKAAVEYRSANFVLSCAVFASSIKYVPPTFTNSGVLNLQSQLFCTLLCEYLNSCVFSVQGTGFGQWLTMPGGLGPSRARSPTSPSIKTACFSAIMFGKISRFVLFAVRLNRLSYI